MLILSGSPGRIRTYDQSLNRRLRYHCATGEYTHLPKNTNNLTGVVTDNFLVKIFATLSRPALRGSDLASRYPSGLTPPCAIGECVCFANTDMIIAENCEKEKAPARGRAGACDFLPRFFCYGRTTLQNCLISVRFVSR